MALKIKDDADLALLEVVEDPVWFGEFLRSTSDGAYDSKEWPSKPFKYQWYQRDLLTDKNEYIVLSAGRSVGKCSPESAKIYTTEGYRTIGSILKTKETSFGVYALDEHNNFVQRRAELSYNGRRNVYTVKTDTGITFNGTDNHPLLTQRGYVEIRDLDIDKDRVAVVTKLPHTYMNNTLSWFDLRFLGYVLGGGRIAPELPMKLRFQAQVIELKRIAEEFGATLRQEPDGRYRVKRKSIQSQSYAGKLLETFYPGYGKAEYATKIPQLLMNESLGNIKIFLEAFLSLHAEFSSTSVKYAHPCSRFVHKIQELLLRFGVETKITKIQNERWGNVHQIETTTYRAYYNMFTCFSIPGVRVSNLVEPDPDPYTFENYRLEKIASITKRPESFNTYAVYVHYDHNYISDGLIVHNSIVLEDKIVHESVNVDLYFPETKEQLLTTANQAQIDPVLGRLILRFTGSQFLSGFLKGNINRSKGTFDFPTNGGSLPYRIYTRIAGKTGETNIVGLHLPRVKIDESQLYPMSAWTQLGPCINSWESTIQVFAAGVPSGGRDGNVLFMLDQQNPNYKKYRIPGPCNRRWSLSDHIEALRKYGGEDSQEFQNLVLGRHGTPIFNLIPYESIVKEPFEFYSYRYHGDDKSRVRSFTDLLGAPEIDQKYREKRCVLAIDTGFTDPTIIQVFGQDAKGIWRVLVRYRLTRIPYPEQAEIMDWVFTQYKADHICLDLGAGGSGIAVMQDLMSDRFPKVKQYARRISGVRFSDAIVSGQDPSGNDLRATAKAVATQQLAKMFDEKSLRLSEIDMEALSQMSRVTATKLASGENKYFVLSDKGVGAAGDDHIYASFVVFAITFLTTLTEKQKTKKRFSAKWM